MTDALPPILPAPRPGAILVPIDGSPFAERAIPVAASFARLLQARLHLVRVHVPLSAVPVPGDLAMPVYDARWDQEARDAAQAYLDRLAETVRAESGCPVVPALTDGNVTEELIAYGEAHGCGLVVSASHSRTGLARILEGSVTDQLVRHGPAPVVVVHPTEERESFTPVHAPQRFVVPLDGSRTAEQVLPLALTLAEAAGGELLLFGALTPSAVAAQGDREAGAPDGDGTPDLPLREYLASVASRLPARVRTEQRVATASEPAAAILDVADAWNADLVVMASHGRGGLRRAFLGSVADRVLQQAPVNVLVMRS